MPKRTILHNLQRGFTLLEIMLVIVLIALASVGVMIAMPHQLNEVENVDWQAQRFSTQLQLAQDDALISGKELAIVLDEDSYRFVSYDHEQKKWFALESLQIGKPIRIPETLLFEFELLGSVWDEIDTQENDSFIDDDERVSFADEDKAESFSPQVFVMSSGQVTPFSVQFSELYKGADNRISRLEVDMSGSIKRFKSSDE